MTGIMTSVASEALCLLLDQMWGVSRLQYTPFKTLTLRRVFTPERILKSSQFVEAPAGLTNWKTSQQLRRRAYPPCPDPPGCGFATWSGSLFWPLMARAEALWITPAVMVEKLRRENG